MTDIRLLHLSDLHFSDSPAPLRFPSLVKGGLHRLFVRAHSPALGEGVAPRAHRIGRGRVDRNAADPKDVGARLPLARGRPGQETQPECDHTVDRSRMGHCKPVRMS